MVKYYIITNEKLYSMLQEAYQTGYDEAMGCTGKSPSETDMKRDVEKIIEASVCEGMPVIE